MTNYYTKYIEPILNGLPSSARTELLKRYSVQATLQQTKKNIFGLKKHSVQETTVSNFYWHVAQLYTDSNFMHSFYDTNFKRTDKIIDPRTGKLSTPKRFHSIFETKQLDSGEYVCHVRGTKTDYRFNVIPKKGKKNEIFDAVCRVSQIPLLSIDERLALFKFIIENSTLKYVQLPKKEKYRGHQSDMAEISAELTKQNSILKIQDKIHSVQSDFATRLANVETRIINARNAQNTAVANIQNAVERNASSQEIRTLAQRIIDAAKEYEISVNHKNKLQTEQQEAIDALKKKSGLPFAKLHSWCMRQK